MWRTSSLPRRGVEILDVAKWEWADVVVPIGIRHPEAKELVPSLLKSQHSLRVVRQLADQKDLQPVGRHRRIRAIADRAKRSNSSM